MCFKNICFIEIYTNTYDLFTSMFLNFFANTFANTFTKTFCDHLYGRIPRHESWHSDPAAHSERCS